MTPVLSPFCLTASFIRLCLSTLIFQAARVFLELVRPGGERGWGGSWQGQASERVSLFPGNECNFHSFPQDTGSTSSSGQGVAVVSNGPSNGSALGLYLMP